MARCLSDSDGRACHELRQIKKEENDVSKRKCVYFGHAILMFRHMQVLVVGDLYNYVPMNTHYR